MPTLNELTPLVSNCKACPLYTNMDSCPCSARYENLFGKGIEVLVVAHAPNDEDDLMVQTLADRSGYFIRSTIDRVFGKEKVAYTYLRKCKGKGGVRDDRFCGNLWLVKEIEAIQPKLIITLGVKAANYIEEIAPSMQDTWDWLILKSESIYFKGSKKQIAKLIEELQNVATN